NAPGAPACALRAPRRPSRRSLPRRRGRALRLDRAPVSARVATPLRRAGRRRPHASRSREVAGDGGLTSLLPAVAEEKDSGVRARVLGARLVVETDAESG